MEWEAALLKQERKEQLLCAIVAGSHCLGFLLTDSEGRELVSAHDGFLREMAPTVSDVHQSKHAHYSEEGQPAVLQGIEVGEPTRICAASRLAATQS